MDPIPHKKDLLRLPRLEHENPAHRDTFVINWVFGNRCNYKCSYCPKDLHDGSESLLFEKDNWPYVERFCRNLLAQIPTHKTPYFVFAGGEITLYAQFFPLMELLKGEGAKVGLISNGSRPVVWWEKAMKFVDHVSLSFHPEFSKKDHFVEVLKTLTKDQVVHVNVMMLPTRFDECLEHAQKLSMELDHLTLSLQPLLENLGEKIWPYTNEQLEKMSALVLHSKAFTHTPSTYRGLMKAHDEKGNATLWGPSQLISSGVNKWIGWQCFAGVEQIVVDVDGEIYRSWCFLQPEHPRPHEGRLGNLFDDDWALPSLPIICKKKMCHCNLDIMCTKIQGKMPQQDQNFGSSTLFI